MTEMGRPNQPKSHKRVLSYKSQQLAHIAQGGLGTPVALTSCPISHPNSLIKVSIFLSLGGPQYEC
jgi:hypothetical protein